MQRQIASRMRWRRKAASFALPVLGAVLLGTTACATSSYMGISMIPGEASPEVQALAQRAQAGDKHAQLDLGIRFEEGNGVPQDKGRALKLYRQAASDSGGMQMMYVPSSTGSVRSIPVHTGSIQPGLRAAKERISGDSSEIVSDGIASPGHKLTIESDETDLQMLLNAFDHRNIGRVTSMYPGVKEGVCLDVSHGLKIDLNQYMKGGMSLPPLACVLQNYTPMDIHDLSRSKDVMAKLLYISLISSYISCNDTRSLNYLSKTIENGYIISAIISGNLHKKCGDFNLAIEDYVLAERLGYPGASLYYRPLIEKRSLPSRK